MWVESGQDNLVEICNFQAYYMINAICEFILHQILYNIINKIRSYENIMKI